MPAMEMTRPNGKLYRARKDATTVLFPDGDTGPTVLVLRVSDSDYDLAVRYALNRVERWDRFADIKKGTGFFGWWRMMIQNHEDWWVNDEIRGVPGWLFQVI